MALAQVLVHPLLGSDSHGGFTAYARNLTPGQAVTKVKIYHTGVHLQKATARTKLDVVPHDLQTLKRQLKSLTKVHQAFQRAVGAGQAGRVTDLRVEVRITLESPQDWEPERFQQILDRHTTLKAVDRTVFGSTPSVGLSKINVNVQDALDAWARHRAEAEDKGLTRGQNDRRPRLTSTCMLADLQRQLGISSTRLSRFTDVFSWKTKDPNPANGPNFVLPTAVRRQVRVQRSRPTSRQLAGNDFSHLM